MRYSKFLDNLRLLDFEVNDSRYGLLFCANTTSAEAINFEDLLILEQAKSLKADAVYIRRFPENQTSIPQVYIYDNTNNSLSNDYLAEVHRKIWTSGIVPIYYVFDRTQIRIFDARNPVEHKNDSLIAKHFDSIDLVSSAHRSFEKYSAKLFANGTFWEHQENKNRFLKKDSAETAILEGLKKIRKQFLIETNLDSKIANRILVLSILVKYLEERKDEKGNHVFPSNFFSKYNQSSSFCDVLRKGKIIDLFNDLSAHFNGKIFELEESEKQAISNIQLANLANYLDGNNKNDQYVIWRLYSFEDLPVELISRIYEEFMPEGRNDAVYTPVHLARFMVDESMPINNPKEKYKVIDVSCGSGIFLVTVYKRLVQWWQKRQFDSTGQLVKPDTKVLKQILLESIHGVDVEPEAVRLSVFSLSLALCDMLSPTEIWTKLKFENLKKKNIYEGNFFQYLKNNPKGDFDLVIGNPPFEDKLDNFDLLYDKYSLTKTCEIPRHQIALLFLEQAMNLLNNNGLLSFVMPSGPLLYNNTSDFRKTFFLTYEIPQIIDFSMLSLKGYLFERAVSTAVIFAQKRKPASNHKILHIPVRRTSSARERLFFEIDHYDFHYVPIEVAINNNSIWKANLFGGGQLFFLTNRLRSLRSLKSYLLDKKKNNGWFFGEGYNYGNRSKRAPHLTGKKMIETSQFTEEGIVGKIKIEQEEWFEGIRKENKLIFSSPHLLIKNNSGKRKFIATYLDYDLIFKDEIFGIHSPKGQEKDLKKIERTLQNNYSLYKMLLLSSSSRAGVSRSSSTLLMKDFLALPYPENQTEMQLSSSERIVCDDVLNFGLDSLSKGENAILNKANADASFLIAFRSTLCDSLNPIYQKEQKKFYTLEPIEGLSFFCLPLVYGDQTVSISVPVEKIKQGDFSPMLENKQDAVLYKRVLRLYQKDVVFIIKPKTLRYWQKSIALRDASEIMLDLVNSGF